MSDRATPATPFLELYDRIDKTGRCRFKAHRRLLAHAAAAQWTVTGLSVLLIALPLLQAYGVVSASDGRYNVTQVILAVALLAFTLRLEASNFAVRAERMLDCGKELSTLMHRIFPFRDAPYDSRYDALLVDYEQIVARYENHTDADYRLMKLQMTDYYKPTGWEYASARLWYLAEFWSYTFALVGAGAWVWHLT